MAKIVDKLDNINKTLEKMLIVINKPESPFLRILSIAGMFASFLAIIHVIDTILSWIKESTW